MLKRQKVKGTNQTKITFIVDDDPNQAAVYVVGDFNDWDQNADLLVKRNNDTRSVSLNLNPGRYAFRYCTADGHWFNDDAADDYEPSSIGSDNCIVVV